MERSWTRRSSTLEDGEHTYVPPSILDRLVSSFYQGGDSEQAGIDINIVVDALSAFNSNDDNNPAVNSLSMGDKYCGGSQPGRRAPTLQSGLPIP